MKIKIVDGYIEFHSNGKILFKCNPESVFSNRTLKEMSWYNEIVKKQLKEVIIHYLVESFFIIIETDKKLKHPIERTKNRIFNMINNFYADVIDKD